MSETAACAARVASGRRRWLRLLRHEVEALVKKKHGLDHLKEQQAKIELAHVNRELKRLKTQVAALEGRKSQLVAELG